MRCLECGRGFHDECEHEECPVCEICNPNLVVAEESDPVEVNNKESHYDKHKKFQDPHSTGRHRAAQLFPFVCNMCGHTKQQHGPGCDKCECDGFVRKPCEWRELKNCGGGENTIVGCGDGVQTDRHHGPIIDPLRNEIGNVHRLCAKCHQRWHLLNDEYYEDQKFMTTVHKGIPATAKEILDNELKWSDGWFNRNFKLKQIRGKFDAFD